MNKSLFEPYAVIFPLPENLALHILEDKKSVFVKYFTHETISPKIESCKKLLFYISSSNKQIKGEAQFESVSLLTPKETISKYCKDLFLSEDELLKYSIGREDKKMLVFVLTKIKKYQEPKYLDHPITMMGEYISKEMYCSLV